MVKNQDSWIEEIRKLDVEERRVLRKRRLVFDSEYVEQVGEEFDLLEWLDRRMLLETIEECARRVLTERQYELYRVLYVEGYTMKEAAELLKISYVNVRKTNHVLINKIRRELTKLL